VSIGVEVVGLVATYYRQFFLVFFCHRTPAEMPAERRRQTAGKKHAARPSSRRTRSNSTATEDATAGEPAASRASARARKPTKKALAAQADPVVPAHRKNSAARPATTRRRVHFTPPESADQQNNVEDGTEDDDLYASPNATARGASTPIILPVKPVVKPVRRNRKDSNIRATTTR
jgi:cytoskeletal protein RodZ